MNINSIARSITTISLGAVLGFTGCLGKKNEVVPYYAFSEQDKQWLQQTASTEWRFSNGRQEKRFRIDSVVATNHVEERSGSGGILLGNNKLLFYHDKWRMSIVRTDSAGPAGYVEISTAGRYQTKPVKLFATGHWYNYIGIDSGSGGVLCQQLNFDDLSTMPFQMLVISGRRYEHVVTLESSGFAVPNCYYPFPTRTSIRRIYYDQQAGIVRLEDKSGEIWNRMP